MTTSGKVVTERTPLDLPDRTSKRPIDYEGGPSLKRPEANSIIGGAREEVPRVGGWSEGVFLRRTFDGWREGYCVDGCRVSNEATGAGWRVVLSSSDNSREGVAMKAPNPDERFLCANSDKVVVVRELDAGNAGGGLAMSKLPGEARAYLSRVLWNVNMQMETPGAIPLFSGVISILNRSRFSLIF